MNQDHLKILQEALEKKEIGIWNEWKVENYKINPDLSGADLIEANLSGADLTEANLNRANLYEAFLYEANLYEASLIKADLSRSNLREADLSRSNLREADLSRSNLKEAKLIEAKLIEADLIEADLSGANLSGADLGSADLRGADLSRADLSQANLVNTDLINADLYGTNLSGADLSGAYLFDSKFRMTNFENSSLSNSRLGLTTFGLTDLSTCIGLDTIEVSGDCIIDFQTLQKSKDLPSSFLRKIGLPDLFIDYLPEFVEKPLNLFPVFLSHTGADKHFARKLYEALINKGVLVWFDEKKLKPGDHLMGGISKGIETYDKMILVCSQHSLGSWWVKEELERILEKERMYQRKTGKREGLLIPVTVDNHIHHASNEYTATIRKMVVGDFIDWEDEGMFEQSLNQLIEALNVDRGGKEPISFL